MADDEFRLPASQLGDLERIIAGYASRSKEDGVSNDDVESACGIDSTTVSRNNRFLEQVDILEKVSRGSRRITKKGEKLGKAVEVGIEEDVSSYWRKVIQDNEFLSEQLTLVRLNDIGKSELAKRILLNSNTSTTSRMKTGSKTLVDIYEKAGLIEIDEDNKLRVSTSPGKKTKRPSNSKGNTNNDGKPAQELAERREDTPESPRGDSAVYTDDTSININIQLELPETSNPEVYDELFRSLRENLLSPSDE